MGIDFRMIARQTLYAQAEPCTVTQSAGPYETRAVPTTIDGEFEDGSQYQLITVAVVAADLQEPIAQGHEFNFGHATFIASAPVDPDQDGILNIKAYRHYAD